MNKVGLAAWAGISALILFLLGNGWLWNKKDKEVEDME